MLYPFKNILSSKDIQVPQINRRNTERQVSDFLKVFFAKIRKVAQAYWEKMQVIEDSI